MISFIITLATTAQMNRENTDYQCTEGFANKNDEDEEESDEDNEKEDDAMTRR